ncbi:putative cell envelope-related transcriptional attenuator domain protein [Paenarthrobacter aurescens TC1]|uniref:Cell envelope-related transcriptional attenuator domain protein n=2 Tax=Paenarthrobacter aurescens TaxID=43663 RepID=A1R9L4_PAEAT|nr:putative cell envelope-related transcriptional attenuator domain protein [Paenarthrobacter aurescens TC1]
MPRLRHSTLSPTQALAAAATTKEFMTLSNHAQNPSAEYGSHRTKKGKKTTRNVLLGFAAAVLLLGLVAGSYVFNLMQSFNSGSTKIHNAFPEESTRPQKAEGNTAMNILVLGSDSRGSSDADVEANTATDQRADTLMLVHVPADRKKTYAISLMRDLWIDIPGVGESKINAALAYGGVPLMVQTVESLLQQRIDHVAMIDFQGFKGLTDALGGVEVDVRIPFAPSSGPKAGQVYDAGKQTLNGDEALAFVRERKAFSDGDYQRVRNQQAYLKAIIGKVIARETLTNPVTISNMVSAVSPFVSVDKDFDAAAIGSLALSMKDVRAQDTVMFTLPTLGTGTSPDGQSIVLADTTAIADVTAALAKDQVDAYITAHALDKGF